MTVQLAVDGCIVCRHAAGEEAIADGVLGRCLECGFTRTTATGDGEAQPDLFDGVYYRDYFARAAQWRYEAARRLRWLLAATRPASLVEAGSAGGYFLQAAQRAGIAASGVEPSEVCVRYARDQLGMSVRQGFFEDRTPATVQAVCAFHVLEHVDDPREFLATARAALTPGGWLALEVPNIASAAAVRAGGSWAHLQPGCHRWHFSPQSLTSLVQDCGFLVRRCDTISSRHYTRSHRRLSRPGASMLLADWTAFGSPKTTHPGLGEHLRLLARLPETRSAP
jgi:SAM-dependent methyltransferase